jgi:hypothetical protein
LKQFIAVLLCVLLPVVGFAGQDTGYKVRYDGGSIPNLKSGDDVKLYVEETQVRIVKDKKDVKVIPATAITEISYGQDVHRRIGTAIGIGVFTLGIGALMALSKSKKHYIGLTWDDDGKKGGFAFRAEKGEYRGIMSGLEGISGKQVVNTDAMKVNN